ncbi:uncharacterized protein [Musca autumnalis]|uniref:uncharacterized protein n=1 Tax=Musca autumnalis TaxID=221902 RepID=UPI003CEC4C99
MLQLQRKRPQMMTLHQVTHIWPAQRRPTTTSLLLAVTIICMYLVNIAPVWAGVFFPRGGSFGYLAAVAIPVDLPNRNIYMAFNFESNYGLPSNDSYNEWIDRWDLDETYLGVGNNVTVINNRNLKEKKRKRSTTTANNTSGQQLLPRYDRRSFYRTFTGYLDHYQMNGTGCLLRTICEVAASTMDENNGVLGSILKILFMPTTSRPEKPQLHNDDINDEDLYRAEWQGRKYLANNNMDELELDGDNEDNNNNKACLDYIQWCPEGVISMITNWY